jgi:transcriptional regulator with XRE-family HTH domain
MVDNMPADRLYSVGGCRPLPDTSSVYRSVGQKIRLAREAAGQTQDGLARRIGAKRTSITNIESGRQPLQLHMLLAIAEALKVPAEQLLPSIEPREPNPSVSDDLAQRLAKLLPHDLAPRERDWVLRILQPLNGIG